MNVTVKVNLIAGVVVLTALSVLAGIYLSFFDFRAPPIRVNYSHPVINANDAKDRAEIIDMPSVKPGGVFYTYRDYCLTSLFTVLRNERRLVPEDKRLRVISMPLLPTRVINEIGCDHRSFASTLPLGTPPGVYTFSVHWAYKLKDNPLATFEWDWPGIKLVVE